MYMYAAPIQTEPTVIDKLYKHRFYKIVRNLLKTLLIISIFCNRLILRKVIKQLTLMGLPGMKKNL